MDMPSGWDECPPEVLLMILEKLPPSTLTTCMFVNSKWRALCEYLAKVHNYWPEIVRKEVVHDGVQLKVKSKSLDWHQVYVNSLLWNHAEKASYTLMNAHRESNIKKLNVYRDNLIVINCLYVRYYGIDNFELRKEFAATCFDFIENDNIIVQVCLNWDNNKKIILYGKESEDDFRIGSGRLTIVDGVSYYSVENNRCYLIDSRNFFIIYTYNHPEWEERFIARYYGTPGSTCGFNVYNSEAYLWLKCGTVLWADIKARSFKKVLMVNTPVTEESVALYRKIFHICGFVYGLRGDRDFIFDRYLLSENTVYVFECPNLSCATEHGDMLFLGYLNGIVEIYIPRKMKTKNSVKRIDLKELMKDIEEPGVVSIEVCEDIGFQHLVICTHSYIFHFTVTYPDCEQYLWKDYPSKAEMKLSFDTEGNRYDF